MSDCESKRVFGWVPACLTRHWTFAVPRWMVLVVGTHTAAELAVEARQRPQAHQQQEK